MPGQFGKEIAGPPRRRRRPAAEHIHGAEVNTTVTVELSSDLIN